MEVRKIMHGHPCIVPPDCTIRQAAQKMEEFGCGVLPVGDEKKIIGMVTDRDIVIRALAEGKSQKTLVKDIMTKKVVACYDDDSLEAATEAMRSNDVSRLLVINHKDKVLGIISFAQLLRNTGNLKESDHVVHHLLKQSAPGRPPAYKDWKQGKRKASS